MSALSSNTKYYKEAYHLFQQCKKNEDRQDLANKVFEEVTTTTSDTCTITKGCSRELEQLLPHVTSTSTLSAFFDRLTQDDLDDFIRDRSASFVLEKLFAYLPNLLSIDNEQIHSSYDRLFQCICENFTDYIQETGTSHIIAVTISFLHPVISSHDPNEYEQLIDGGRTAKQFVQLSSEWQVMEKLRQMKKLIKKSTTYNEYVYATLLRTCGYLNNKFYIKLVDHVCAKYYSDITLEHLLDKRSSFIFEVLLEFPSEQRNDILYPMVLNHIEEIYLHEIGNFFLQHLLLTVNDKEVIEKIYQLIIDEERFDKLVHQGQIRLLITFIRVCERFQCHYEELINRLKTAVHCTKNNSMDFIPCLLKLRAGDFQPQSITKEGSLVIQALLRAKQIDSLTRQSFLSLTGEQISSIACHPSGSHLLCQLILKSSLWPILREKNFYGKLDQVYPTMACDKAACWFVTQLWKSAITIEQKLHMAKSMAKDFQSLRSHTYARFITYEMNLTAYCSRPDQWKRSIDMFHRLTITIFLLFLILLVRSLHTFDIELTILIPASQRECFHEILEAGKTVEIEYEVLAGGDVDINYWFYSPTNRVLQSDFKKRDGHQTLKLEESGEYRFCFDNSVSRFNQKQVYFSLRLINEQGHNENDRVTQSWMKTIDKDDLGELQTKIQEFKDTFQRIWDNMEAAQRYQKAFNNYELHDRVIAENNFERVNFWSMVQLVLMISVSVIQVVTIRSLFESKSSYGKLLRGKK